MLDIIIRHLMTCLLQITREVGNHYLSTRCSAQLMSHIVEYTLDGRSCTNVRLTQSQRYIKRLAVLRDKA